MRELLGFCLAVVLTGCASTTPKLEQVPELPPDKATEAAAKSFADGLEQLAKHDAAGDWNEERCRGAAEIFRDAALHLKSAGDEQAVLAARYNEGVAYQRCKMTSKARPIFEALLEADPKHHRARVRVAIYRLEERGAAGLDEAIEQLQTAVVEAEFNNVDALVNLAMLQMRRAGTEHGSDEDFNSAHLNLQRALAKDDSYMPAFNQLVVYYLERARRNAGKRRLRLADSAAPKVRADSATLELAALVCSQALRKNPRYAAIHNTAGLISAELGNYSEAARSFAAARAIDPSFFEAHMNYAAVNMQFRGFKRARTAYEVALRLKPNDYDARLGLALALRGQIGVSGNAMLLLAESTKHLQAAKRLDSSRPEAYYNEAVLVQEFRARSAGPQTKPMLLKAKSLLTDFVKRAEGKPEFRAAIERANSRMHDIDVWLDFLDKQGTP